MEESRSPLAQQANGPHNPLAINTPYMGRSSSLPIREGPHRDPSGRQEEGSCIMEQTSQFQRHSSFLCMPQEVSIWCSSRRFSRRSFDDEHDPLQQSPSSSRRLTIVTRWRGLWKRVVREKRKIFNSRTRMHARYDEYTYAQNFDEGAAWVEPDNLCRSFSARFAVPSSTFLLQRVS